MNLSTFDTELEELKINAEMLTYAKKVVEDIGEWPVKLSFSFSYCALCAGPEMAIHTYMSSEVTDQEKHMLLAWLTKKFKTSFESFWNTDHLVRSCHIPYETNRLKWQLAIYLNPMPIGKNCKVKTEEVTVTERTLVCPVKG